MRFCSDSHGFEVIMACPLVKENNRLKRELASLKRQHQADIAKMREILSNGSNYETNNPLDSPADGK